MTAALRRLNHCRDSGASVGGRSQGGARWTSYTACPTCGKRIAITSAGRLRAHGTYVTIADRFGNVTREHGVDRCYCGSKYWENDRCIDCGGTDVDPDA